MFIHSPYWSQEIKKAGIWVGTLAENLTAIFHAQAISKAAVLPTEEEKKANKGHSLN